MKAIMTEQSLFIPKEELTRWGKLVVEEKLYQITAHKTGQRTSWKGVFQLSQEHEGWNKR